MNDIIYTSAKAVVKSDSVVLARTGGLYIGGTGDVAVVMAGAGKATVTFKAVPVGTVLPVSVQQVLETGTTATNIVALR